MSITRILASATFALVAAVSASGCIISSDGNDATLEVNNQSDYTIDELYLTVAASSSWGPNLLGGDSLFPNERVVLGVNCDYYDALLVDETGAQCEVLDVDLCLNDAVWIIRNNTCNVFGKGAGAHETVHMNHSKAATQASTSSAQ